MSNTVAAVVAALIQVESAGRNISGDQGRSAGILQMKPVAVREANRIAGEPRWTDSDRWSPTKSREMATTILRHHYQTRGVRDPVELGARWRNPYSPAPVEYKQRVRQELQRSEGVRR